MNRANPRQRLEARVTPSVGLRIVPAPLFEGRLGPADRLYVCVADAEELGGLRLSDAVDLVYGGVSVSEERMTQLYGRPVHAKYARFQESVPSPIETYSEYYVVELDLRVGELDLFPGTWKSMAYILSDRERMLPALDVYEEFRRMVRDDKPFGQSPKSEVDFYELGEAISGDVEYPLLNPQSRYYEFLTTESWFGNTVTRLFGFDCRCWHGRGYVGTGGVVACRVFLVRNLPVSGPGVLSCRRMGRDEVLGTWAPDGP